MPKGPRLFSVLMVSASFALLFPGNAAPVGSDPCDSCQDGIGGGGIGHSFQGPGALFLGPGHISWSRGSCAAYHVGCMITRGLDPNDAEEVVLKGDPSEVRKLLEKNGEFVTLNVARSAIQIRDCDGHLIRHVTIPLDLTMQLADVAS